MNRLNEDSTLDDFDGNIEGLSNDRYAEVDDITEDYTTNANDIDFDAYPYIITFRISFYRENFPIKRFIDSVLHLLDSMNIFEKPDNRIYDFAFAAVSIFNDEDEQPLKYYYDDLSEQSDVLEMLMLNVCFGKIIDCSFDDFIMLISKLRDRMKRLCQKFKITGDFLDISFITMKTHENNKAVTWEHNRLLTKKEFKIIYERYILDNKPYESSEDLSETPMRQHFDRNNTHFADKVFHKGALEAKKTYGLEFKPGLQFYPKSDSEQSHFECFLTMEINYNSDKSFSYADLLNCISSCIINNIDYTIFNMFDTFIVLKLDMKLSFKPIPNNKFFMKINDSFSILRPNIERIKNKPIIYLCNINNDLYDESTQTNANLEFSTLPGAKSIYNGTIFKLTQEEINQW